jgi:hypothetical protein
MEERNVRTPHQDMSEKLINARSIFESWVVLSALNVLDTLPTIICYCNKTCTLALARNQNLLFHKSLRFKKLLPIHCTATQKTRKKSNSNFNIRKHAHEAVKSSDKTVSWPSQFAG